MHESGNPLAHSKHLYYILNTKLNIKFTEKN